MTEVWTLPVPLAESYKEDSHQEEPHQEEPNPHLVTLLSIEERKRLSAFHFERNRREFLYAHALKRMLLSRHNALPPERWQFMAGPWGKPQVVPAVGLHFNLSHTAGLVACAVSSEGEIGIDIERVDRQVEALDIARRFFTEAEVRQIDVPDPDRAREFFFRIWTLKEAYVKALGRGFDLPLKSFEVILGQSLSGWHLREYTPHEHYRMAVAAKTPPPDSQDARNLLL